MKTTDPQNQNPQQSIIIKLLDKCDKEKLNRSKRKTTTCTITKIRMRADFSLETTQVIRL